MCCFFLLWVLHTVYVVVRYTISLGVSSEYYRNKFRGGGLLYYYMNFRGKFAKRAEYAVPTIKPNLISIPIYATA